MEVDADGFSGTEPNEFQTRIMAVTAAFIMMGNGDGAECHMPTYDFNDAAIPTGIEYWIRLVERAMPVT